jgi:hypothetical protein
MKEGGEKGERRKPPRKEKREDGEDGGGGGHALCFCSNVPDSIQYKQGDSSYQNGIINTEKKAIKSITASLTFTTLTVRIIYFILF